MSSYTSEIVVGSAIVVALGVAAYMVGRPPPTQPDESPPSTTQKKQPKKKKPALQDSLQEKALSPPPAPRTHEAAPPATIPGGFAPLDNDELSAASGSNTGSVKKKKKKPVKRVTGNSATATPLEGPTLTGTAAAPTQKHLSSEHSAQKSLTDEGPWTRVESRRKTESGTPESASDAGVTPSITEEEGSVTGQKQRPAGEKLTLAEKLLPSPAKTAVDDMLEGPKPSIARVLRVPQTYDRPSGTADWGDYEDAEDVRGVDPDTDDGWSVVPEKTKRLARAGGSGYASATSTTVAAPKAASSSESQSKNANKNAKKKEAAKAVKAASEAAQQAALARHRREQEAERIAEQFKTKSKQSGGMSASLNGKGQLVWD